MAVSSIVEVENTIAQIMALERESINKLEQDKTDLSLKNSTLAEIDSSLETLQEKLALLKLQETFISNSAISTDSNVATATASSSSVQSIYQMEVIRLAQVAKITSSSSLGLSDGSYAVLQSGEEINASGTGAVTVDPNVTFASGTAAVGFETAKTVVSGSFRINGSLVTVAGSDTIYTILSKINSKSTGVTATFDETNDRVVLTTSSVGDGQTISLTEDSSGIFDALKLEEINGNPAPSFTDGVQADLYRALNVTPLVSGTDKIVDGYFTINNITFSVNASSDSLYTVLNRINNSQAGVSAFYDDVTNKITVSSRETGDDLYFENDTSNFLEFIDVQDKTGDLDGDTNESHYEGTTAEVMINGETVTRDGNVFALGGTTFNVMSTGTANISVLQDKEKAVSAVYDFVSQFNHSMSLIDTKLKTTMKSDRSLLGIKRKLQQKIFRPIENTGGLDRLTDAGLNFITTGGYGLGRLMFTKADFRTALETNSQDVFNLFADDSDSDGNYDDGGFAVLTDAYLEEITKNSSGLLARKTDGNSKVIERLNKRIEKEEEKLAREEEQLRADFNKLNSAVSAMDQQVQALQAFSSSMNAITSSYY